MDTIFNKSIDELAGKRGISTFDTALPQDWLESVMRLVHWPTIPNGVTSPLGHIVWCYDDSLTGIPMAVDYIGDRILGQYASAVR